MPVTITPERPDTEAAMELIAELEAHLSALYPAESRHGYSVDKLLREGVAFFVIRRDGIPAGCGGIQLFGREYGELKRMYVRPAVRGLGLGKLMLEHLETYARNNGVDRVRLETGIHQLEAIGLYERMGFERIGPFGSYRNDPLSLFYEKVLRPKSSFELQPTLKGNLLELRPLRPDDFPDLFAVASDPHIWEQHPIRDRYKEEVFQGFFRDALQSGGALVAIDSKEGRIIGSSRFHGYDKEKSEVEIGWTFLARSHWGGVFNREMKQLMLRHAFRFVDCVNFVVGTKNWRSQKAVEKIGGIRRGTKTDAAGRENFVYQLTRAAFAQGGLA